MSNEHKIPNSARAALKLTDTQLILLSAAARRDDLCLTATPNLKGGAAQKVAEKLIATGLVKEIKAKAGTPVWRCDEETAQSFALKLTAAGLKAIAVDDGAIEETPSESASIPTNKSRRKGASARDQSDQDSNEVPPNRGEGSSDGAPKPRERGAPSAPRSGSKTAAIIDLLQRSQGAALDELIAATGWLPHTTRAALTGLKKRGYEIARNRSDGITRYRIETASNGLNEAKDEGASATLRDGQVA